MKMKWILLILLLPMSLIYSASGGSGGEYLSTYGSGARPLGMGGAFTGLSDDSSAIYYNPAGLAQVNRKEIYTLFSPIFPGQDVNFYSVSYAQPLFGYGRIGLNWLYLGSGGYIGRDWRGYETGITYSETINTFLLAYATPQYKQVLSGGLNFKFLFHSIDGLGRSYFGFGADLAGHYRPFRWLSSGVMIQNIIQPKMKLSDTEESFPINFRFGLAGHLFKDRLNITTDINLIEPFATDSAGDGKMQVRYFTGAEFTFLKLFAIRGGYNFKEITGGFGIKYWGLCFDYAYAYNYEALMANSQYLRVSLIIRIDELPIFKAPKPEPIRSTSHLIMGGRPKKLKTDKKMDSQIDYELIDCHDSQFISVKPFHIGLTVDNYYSFLKDSFYNTYKFIIPVQESGFTYVYDAGLKEYINKNKNLVISFYIPGTHLNMKDSGPIDIQKSSKYICDALLHYVDDLKLPVMAYEIVYPESSFVSEDIVSYNAIVDSVLDYIKTHKLKINLMMPNFLTLFDNKKVSSQKIMETLKTKYKDRFENFSFEFSYENPVNKNTVVELNNLNNHFDTKLAKIKNVFKSEDKINLFAHLNYDLKVNDVKKQYFYALWLANGIKNVLFNKFQGVFVSLKPQSVTYQDLSAKSDMILELNRLYPDLKETDSVKYNQFLEEMNKNLRIKQKVKDEDYDIITFKEKKSGYYVMELFNKYLLDDLLKTKQNYIVTKSKANDKLAVIFVNNDKKEKEVNLLLNHLHKGVYQVKKIVYNNQLFSERIEEPKIIEDYEINIVKELKINSKILATGITIFYLEIQSK